MKIYHYTSLENLALILKHKTIRFNRLDRLDDPCEKSFMLHRLDWSPYTYVSCWTENPTESIPLWHMYNGSGKGVRIAMESGFIDWDKQPVALSVPSRLPGLEEAGVPPSAAFSMRLNPIRIYRPLSDQACFRKVAYVSDQEFEEYERAVGQSPEFSIDEDLMRRYVGRLRKDKWAFQEESRFILYAVPYTATDPVVSHQDFLNLIRLSIPNDVPFIDVPVKPASIESMEVTLGPEADEGQAILAKALLARYAPQARLRFSALGDASLSYLI